MIDLLSAMTAARVGWTSPRVALWAARPVTELIRVAMTEQAGWAGDLAFGESFRDGLRPLGARGPDDALAWANRRVDLGYGDWCVAGIRFRGLDVTKPFVDVVATSLPPAPDSLLTIADVVLPRFDAFGPLALRVDAPAPDTLVHALVTDRRFAAGAVDRYVVAAPVEDVSGRVRGVALRRATPARAVSRVERLYADVRRSRPALGEGSRPASLGELDGCAEEGLLFDVLVDGVTAGVVAARREDDHAMTGFRVVEIVLDDAHRGRQLGREVLRALAAVLPAEPGDTLWGTIHPGNRPSLSNALASGREIVGGYVWVVPRGLPGI